MSNVVKNITNLFIAVGAILTALPFLAVMLLVAYVTVRAVLL